MQYKYLVFILALLVGFFLEHLPLPEILYWFKPEWVILIVTLFILFDPSSFGYWLVIPVGILLDVEHASPIGLHCFMLAVHMLMLHLIYRRLMLFNIVQQSLIICLLVFVSQHASYAVVGLVLTTPEISAWMPAVSSIMVWPWLYVAAFSLFRHMPTRRSNSS